jgi:hypothetical protein
VNTKTGKPFGTEEEIERCHPNEAKVPRREFNPNEIKDYQTMLLNHQSNVTESPVAWNLSSIVTIGSNTSLPVMSVNRIVYDRK